MLLFSTILEIDKKLTKDDFINLVIEWNQKGHPESVISNIEWNGERNIRFEDENKCLEIQEYRNKNIIAVRFEKRESDGAIWDTDYIMNFSEMKMAVRLDRSYIEEALNIIKKDTDIFLKIPYKNNYIYIAYSKENNLFFYCDEFGVNNCKFKDGYNYVLLGILVDNNIELNNIELKYKSQDAFDKYWNNFIYFRGKNNKPV